MKRIIFTVTNDLNYDQRMQRICTSLAANGFAVTLTGRKLPDSQPLSPQIFFQKRLYCFFTAGFAFYAEYNLRLFFYLLFAKAEVICAIDLDTILACYFASALKGAKKVYDAHELFTEQKEIVTRKTVHRCWLAIEKFAVPKFKNGYTVNEFIAAEFKRRYAVQYKVVRNLPVWIPLPANTSEQPKFIIYQGAVNEGRSFETLIPAMKDVSARLDIYGKGNAFAKVQQLIKEHLLESKVVLHGYVLPSALREITPCAYIAVTLFEKTGLNQFYSLSNRFFDYIMAGVPQLCVNYPEYKTINDVYHIAYMIDDTAETNIAAALHTLLANEELYEQLKRNCVMARERLNWNTEEKILLDFYKTIIV